MARRVHYTPHSCLVADPSTLPPCEGRTLTDHDAGDRQPRFVIWIPCSGQRRLVPHRNAYSTKLADVTCSYCARWAAEHVREPIAAAERALRAHRLCCAARGAPLTVSPDHEDEVERVQQAERVAQLLPAMVWVMPGRENELRKWLEGMKRETDQATHDALSPAIDQLWLAAEVADELERMLSRAHACALEVAKMVRSGELELGPDVVAIGGAAMSASGANVRAEVR